MQLFSDPATSLTGPMLLPASGEAPTKLVVFLHGYGADGNDLIDIGKAWAPHMPATAFISPHAPSPCGMAPFGREWFPLPRLSPDEYSKGVYLAADPLNQFITDQAALHQLPMNRIALVGFSQGTMMALHVGFRLPDTLAGILGYSGALAAPENLVSELKSRPPVSLIHGDADEIIPFDMGRAIYEAATDPKSFFEMGGDHNAGFWISRERYVPALDEFLTNLFGPSRARGREFVEQL